MRILRHYDVDYPGIIGCPKTTVWRSEPYLAIVRQLPCVHCGQVGRTQPAHSNQLRFGKGRSLKASDATAMALCAATIGTPGCHDKHDQGGRLTKAEWWDFEYRHITLTIVRLVRLQRLTGARDVLGAIPHVIEDYEATAVRLVGLLESGELKAA